MHWITFKDKDGYPMLIDIQQYSHIFMDTVKDQPKTDLNRTVWGRYDSSEGAIRIYTGTEVECVRIMEQLTEILNPVEIHPWKGKE